MSSANRISESSAAQAKREKRIGGAYHTVSAVPAQSRCRRAALALLLTLPLLAPAAYAQEDDTPPTVESVTYYSDVGATTDTEITEAAIGATIYVAVEFSEKVQNQNTFIDPVNLANNISGQPSIHQRHLSLFSGGNAINLQAAAIIAHDAEFTPPRPSSAAPPPPPLSAATSVL